MRLPRSLARRRMILLADLVGGMGHLKSGRCLDLWSLYIQGSQAVLIMGDRIDQVTYEEYPEEMYPTNCHGTFYLFSANVRNKLLQVFFSFVNCILSPPLQAFLARKEEIFKIDDVFVTGILAKEAGGIKHRLNYSYLYHQQLSSS